MGPLGRVPWERQLPLEIGYPVVSGPAGTKRLLLRGSIARLSSPTVEVEQLLDCPETNPANPCGKKLPLCKCLGPGRLRKLISVAVRVSFRAVIVVCSTREAPTGALPAIPHPWYGQNKAREPAPRQRRALGRSSRARCSTYIQNVSCDCENVEGLHCIPTGAQRPLPLVSRIGRPK